MIMLFLFISATTEQDDSVDQRCGQHGPAIRFPFRLEGLQPQRCGYSRSFDLSCSKDNQTLFQLPTSAKFLLKKIDYKSQTIHLADPDACLPQLIRNVNLSSSPFRYASSRYIDNYTVFYCESEPIYYSITPLPTCLNASGQILYAVSFSSPLENMVSCNHLYDLLSIPSEILWRNTQLALSWSKPKCSVCEAKGKRCRLRSNTTALITECYGAPISGRVLSIFLINHFDDLFIMIVSSLINGLFFFRYEKKTSDFR